MENTWTYPDTTGWYELPFQVGEYKFVSKLDKQQSLYPQVMQKFGEAVFTKMNIDFIQFEMAEEQAVTSSDIRDMLAKINAGASEAVIELVES